MRKFLIRHRLERCKNIFKERIIDSFEDDKRYFEKKLKNNLCEDDYAELVALEDDLIELYNLFCVMLWSCVEPYLNQMGRLLDAEWKESHKWDMIKDCYKDRGVDLRNLPRFAEINIIRLINNCVKHNNSLVTKYLHAVDSKRFKRDVDGKRQKIKIEQKEILSYFSYAEEFLCSLVDICYSRKGEASSGISE